MAKFKLTDVCEIQYGYPFDSSLFSDNGAMPLIRIRDVVRGYTQTYTNEAFDECYIVSKGDLLIGMDGEFNISKWKSEAALLNQRVCRLFPKATVDFNYLFYLMKKQLKEIEDKTPYATVKHLSAKELNKISFLLPTLEIQHQIAEKLDKVTHLIDLCNSILDRLDLLVKARFVEMFGDLYVNPYGWEFVKLSELCDVRDGTHDSPQYVAKGYPLLTSKNFTNGYVDFSEISLISEEDFEAINKRSKVDFGDIVMPMIGTIGHPVIIETLQPFAIKNVALIKFPDERISNVFIKYVLDSEYFKIKVEEKNRGNTQKFIALGDIRSLLIPVVPLNLQTKFATFAAQTDKSKSAVKQVLEKAETLKKALMQEYFG